MLKLWRTMKSNIDEFILIGSLLLAAVFIVIGGTFAILDELNADKQLQERFESKCYAYDGKIWEDECLRNGHVIFSKDNFE